MYKNIENELDYLYMTDMDLYTEYLNRCKSQGYKVFRNSNGVHIVTKNDDNRINNNKRVIKTKKIVGVMLGIIVAVITAFAIILITSKPSERWVADNIPKELLEYSIDFDGNIDTDVGGKEISSISIVDEMKDHGYSSYFCEVIQDDEYVKVKRFIKLTCKGNGILGLKLFGAQEYNEADCEIKDSYLLKEAEYFRNEFLKSEKEFTSNYSEVKYEGDLKISNAQTNGHHGEIVLSYTGKSDLRSISCDVTLTYDDIHLEDGKIEAKGDFETSDMKIEWNRENLSGYWSLEHFDHSVLILLNPSDSGNNKMDAYVEYRYGDNTDVSYNNEEEITIDLPEIIPSRKVKYMFTGVETAAVVPIRRGKGDSYKAYILDSGIVCNFGSSVYAVFTHENYRENENGDSLEGIWDEDGVTKKNKSSDSVNKSSESVNNDNNINNENSYDDYYESVDEDDEEDEYYDDEYYDEDDYE